MTKQQSTFAGFVVAPLIASSLMAVGWLLKPDADPQLILIFTLPAYGGCLALALLLGLPALRIASRFGIETWWFASCVGVAAGLIAALGPTQTGQTLTLSAIGAAAGFGFWAVWKLGRDAPEGPTPPS